MGEIMIELCIVDPNYCNYLRKTDPNVAYNMNQKSNRPFVGILLEIGKYKYYAPLSSPKPKHLTMSNQIDFIKIKGGKLGAINLNNIIPVPTECITVLDLSKSYNETKPETDYRYLLINQREWCRKNEDSIAKATKNLYQLISEGKANPKLLGRCCNFPLNEKQHDKYLNEITKHIHQNEPVKEPECKKDIKNIIAEANLQSYEYNKKLPATEKSKDRER